MSRGFSKNDEPSASGSDLFPNMQLGFMMGVKYIDKGSGSTNVCYGTTPEAEPGSAAAMCPKNSLFYDEEVTMPNDIRNNSTLVSLSKGKGDNIGTAEQGNTVDLRILEKILSAAAGHTEKSYVSGDTKTPKYSVEQAQTILNAAATKGATDILTLTESDLPRPYNLSPTTVVVGLTYFWTGPEIPTLFTDRLPKTQPYNDAQLAHAAGYGVVLGNLGTRRNYPDQSCPCNTTYSTATCTSPYDTLPCAGVDLGNPIGIKPCTSDPKLKSDSVLIVTGLQNSQC